MSPEPDPSAAEAALQDALRHPAPDGLPSSADRQERLRKSFQLQTAAHDLGHFMVGGVAHVIAKLAHALWRLAIAPLADQPKNQSRHDDDEPRP